MRESKRSFVASALGVVAILVVQALALWGMGHPWICTCGFVKLWHGAVDTQNSQHLLDWYTFSHIGHGILFALATLGLRRAFPWARRVPLSVWLIAWVGVEAAWEVFENTPQIIAHYRTNPVSRFYFGDSVINSIGDTLAMIGGYLFVARWGVVAGVTLFALVEAWAYAAIGDSLLTNIWFFLTSYGG